MPLRRNLATVLVLATSPSRALGVEMAASACLGDEVWDIQVWLQILDVDRAAGEVFQATFQCEDDALNTDRYLFTFDSLTGRRHNPIGPSAVGDGPDRWVRGDRFHSFVELNPRAVQIAFGVEHGSEPYGIGDAIAVISLDAWGNKYRKYDVRIGPCVTPTNRSTWAELKRMYGHPR